MNHRKLTLNVLLFVAVFALGTALVSVGARNAAPAFKADVPVATPVLTDQETTFANVYNMLSPSVVSINVTMNTQLPSHSFFSPFGDNGGVAHATGSGFVIDKQGHIVTNNHVVQNATKIEVNFHDGTIVKADVVGTDPDSDLAVIKVDLPSDRLQPVTFGNSDELTIGQMVLAIGSPFGQRWTLTSGIVSALDRTISGLTNYSIGDVIQTDASINPGNSGGPLLDEKGHVIGVNSQIATESNSSAGVGFAIPGNLVQRVAQDLIEKGHEEYSYLGIQGGDMSLTVIDALKLPNDQRGVVVTAVAADGPAAQAGLQDAVMNQRGNGEVQFTKADIITAVNGETINGMGSLISYLASHTKPGDKINLTVLRDGKSIDLSATLTARPHQDVSS